MRFRFIRKVDHPVKTYEGKRVSTGDIVEFSAWFSKKAMRNPNYELADSPSPARVASKKKVSKKRSSKKRASKKKAAVNG